MEIISLVFIVWLIILVIRARSANPQTSVKKQYRYWLRTEIMTPTEQAFYKTLVQVVDDQYLVFPQIRLSSLLNEKVKGQNWKAALWRINQKSVDYVICHADTLKPVIAVELDDWTHNYADRQKRDNDVEQIFASVNFPLLRIKVGTSLEDVAAQLSETLPVAAVPAPQH